MPARKKVAKKVARKTVKEVARKTSGAGVKKKKASKSRRVSPAGSAQVSGGYAPGAGDKYSCTVCGLVVTIDETCGCIETCDIICCGEQMSEM